jgi:preprotein translocase subunit SecG
MQVLMNLVVLVQLVAALAMIGLVLVQHGKGADMGASFGSGASGSLFGATGSANFLSRSTAVCATLFFIATLALAYFGNLRGSVGGGTSVLDRPVAASAAAPAASSAASAVVQIPGATTAPAAAAPASAAASR